MDPLYIRHMKFKKEYNKCPKCRVLEMEYEMNRFYEKICKSCEKLQDDIITYCLYKKVDITKCKSFKDLPFLIE